MCAHNLGAFVTPVAESSVSTLVIDQLVSHLRARAVPLDGQTPPVAVLWTDPRREWISLTSLLRERVDEFLVLGDYAPAERTGPAIWLRCTIDRTLAEPALPADRPPVVYLPGVGRQDLRAGDHCPEHLRPLVELMFRGTMWLQPNGTDWTVHAFLTSPRSLALEVARDDATLRALGGALPEAALTSTNQLTGKRLQAEDFDRMLAPDVIRDLLRWMTDPSGTKARLGTTGWPAFCNRCQDDMQFDPEKQTEIEAARELVQGQDGWQDAWDRFVESPQRYADLVKLLRRSRPERKLQSFFDSDRWPHVNDADEQALREALGKLNGRPQDEAAKTVLELEAEHGKRRQWVWARLGLAPLAEALAPLARMAAAVRQPVAGGSPDDIAGAYIDRGWQADAATWEALAAAPAADQKLIADAVKTLMEPWLDDSARVFQSAVQRVPLPGAAQRRVEADDDGCVVFVDGLRFDLGQRLSERLETRGCRVQARHRWAASPTVTATAKPAATPVATRFTGDELGADFAPRLADTNRPATAEHVRELLRTEGYQVLGDGMFDAPASHPARGWLETGRIDSLGHALGGRLAGSIGAELDNLAERVIALLDAGWKSVRIVTDHGWLLLPGGLPKVDLPRHLTESRWSRCAVVSGGNTTDAIRAPWHWNPAQAFATPPGIACFKKSEEYAHGGLSLQECLTPDLLIERSGEGVVVASIGTVTWRGLRCLVEAAVRGANVGADLRLGRATGVSVAASPKTIEDGAASLVLADDEHEAAPLVIVLLDAAGQVLAQRATRVGENS